MGVKWKLKRGWRTSQRRMVGLSDGWQTLSRMMCTFRWSGTSLSMRFRNLRNSSERCRAVIVEITFPEATLQGGVEVGGAVSAVVVGAALRGAGHQRQDRRGAVQRLDPGSFRPRRATTAAVRRVQVQAHHVAHLVDELRVRGQLELLDEVGLEAERPPVMACTEDRETPTASAIDRVDQCVAPTGADSRVRTITSSTLASPMVRGAPGRGSVAEPVEAALGEPRTPLRGPSLDDTPAPRRSPCCNGPRPPANTMRQRNANACDDDGRRAHRSSVSRSSPANSTATVGRPRRAPIAASDHRRRQPH